MNARFTLRAVLCAALCALALSLLSSPARAGYPLGSGYCREHVYTGYYGNTLQYYPTAPIFPTYRRTTLFVPTYNVSPRLYYPVTVFDSLGRPHIVYQTGYTTFVR